MGSNPTAYFLDGVHRRTPSGVSADANATNNSFREGEVVDSRPAGAEAEEFTSRPVSGRTTAAPPAGKARHMRGPSVGGGWLDYAFGDPWKPTQTLPPASGTADDGINMGGVGTLVLPRSVPIKLEPKVFFANERTFLAWLHIVLMLGAASLTIVSFSDATVVNQLYGVVLLPVSVAYIFYALWQYLRRATMIKQRQPGPFIDVAGPTTLTVILMVTITAQFCIKLHSMMWD